jgi:4-hydroxyphenylpyruvate dioxygenase-like putative hemolysin
MVTAEQVLEAKGIAHVASVAMYNKIGGDKFACGFAWVNVYVDRTNSKQAKELLKAGFKKDYRPKCLSMWNPGDVNVQNVDIKEAGASAMAEYLRALGLNAYAGSRLD